MSRNISEPKVGENQLFFPIFSFYPPTIFFLSFLHASTTITFTNIMSTFLALKISHPHTRHPSSPLYFDGKPWQFVCKTIVLFALLGRANNHVDHGLDPFWPNLYGWVGPPQPPKRRIRICWATFQPNLIGSGWTRFDPTHI